MDLAKTEDKTAASLASDVFGKIAVRLIPFMFVLYVIAYLDRINISFAGLQMNRDLGFNDATFGLGAGVFFIGYFLFGIPSNLLVERFGARRWIAMIMVVWGFISLSMALIQSETMFYVLRFALGVAEAGFFPGMILYLTYWFPKRQLGLAVARFMTAIPAAGVVGGLLAACVPKFNGILGLSEWKWLFIITGAIPVLLRVVSYFYLTDRPAHAKWLTDEERAWLFERLSVERVDHSQSAKHKLSDTLLSTRVWLLAALYFTLALAMYGFQLWLPQIIKRLGALDEFTTALLTTIPAIFQALGMLVVAGHSDRSGERRWHVAASAMLAAVALALSALSNSPLLSMVLLSLAAFGIWGTVGPFWALPTGYLPAGAAAGGIALINSVGNLGGFVGPYIIGLAKHQYSDFNYALMTVSAVLFAGAVIALAVRKCEPDNG